MAAKLQHALTGHVNMSNFQGTFYMKKFFNVKILNISSTIYGFLDLLKSLLLFSSFLQNLQRTIFAKQKILGHFPLKTLVGGVFWVPKMEFILKNHIF
jgi:hypothetical protein